MIKFKRSAQPLMWSLTFLLAALITGCNVGERDTILGAGGATSGAAPGAVVPAANPETITPGALCNIPTGPTVTSADPASGNTLVTTSTTGTAGGGKKILATFSEAIDPTTVNATTFMLTPAGGVALIPASVNYDPATNVATLTTSAALLPDTSYTATISQGVTNTASVPLACIYAWNFKTTALPTTGIVPITLGSATPFAIASAAGIVNTGATSIHGNAVLDPTATCNAVTVDGAGGFGLCGGSAPTLSGSVISPLYPDAGVTSGAIKADLLAAYNSILPANLPGATVLGCGIIGSGGDAGAGIGCAGNSTLPPGVYISATASTIGVTGVLTLDGQGDPNAQFVFQAPSSLTTAAGAAGAQTTEIALINGAKASNVWWQVGSSATLGTYTRFQGNVLAHTSITIETNSTSCGRLLAGAVTASGAFSAHANVVSVPGNANAPSSCK